jgi:hypothetical protein
MFKNNFFYINFVLYFFLLVTLKYIENKNYFDLNIFVKSLKKFEIDNNFPTKNIYAESPSLLLDNGIDKFNLTKLIYDDIYLRYKIIANNYPKKFDKNSVFFISLKEESNEDCRNIDLNKKYLKLVKCAY